MTLTEFLLARIAEDEKVAHDAADTADAEMWESDSDGETVRGFGGSLQDVLRSGWQTGDCGHDCPEVTHAARFDPARVLAECEAKRQIIQGDYWGQDDEFVEGPVVHNVLLILATVYANHPDYQPESPEWQWQRPTSPFA